MFNIQKRQGANLPHWTADGAAYFVTFRLGDSLPLSLLNAYQEERDCLIAAFKENSPLLTAADHERLEELFEDKIQKHLDAGLGQCWMKLPAIAEIVQNALFFFHSQRYHLHAWAIMPNHVHSVLRPFDQFTLSETLHSWKSYTAKEANKHLSRSGKFWQAESYDHLIRDKADFQRCITYTLNNPQKANLSPWKWTGSNVA